MKTEARVSKLKGRIWSISQKNRIDHAVTVVNIIHSNGGGAVSITIEVGPAMDWGWLDLGRHFHLCLLLLDLYHPLLNLKYHPYDKLSAIMT